MARHTFVLGGSLGREVSGEKQIRQEYALLICGEYFRDLLLECGGIGEERMKRLEALRDLCFDALGDPTEADSANIRRQHGSLTSRPEAEVSRCPRCGAERREGEMRICCM